MSSIEQTSTLGRRLTGEFSWTDFYAKLEQELQAFRKRAKVPGFRPGKAPLNLIDRDYPQIRTDVARTLAAQLLSDKMEKGEINLADEPLFHFDNIVTGEPVRYRIEFEVLPTFEAKDLNGVTIDKVVADVADTDIEDTIKQLQEQLQTFEPAEKAATKGDKIECQLTVAVEGQEPETYEDFEVVLGEGRMIPGFETALEGVKAEETKEFTVNFPEEYQHKAYAGKPGRFTAVVKRILTPNLPPVDEVFAIKYGVTEGGIEAFHKELRQELSRELGWKLQQQLKDVVFAKLYEQNPIEVPESQVRREAMRIMRNMFNEYAKHIPKAQLDSMLKHANPSMMSGEAKKRVTLSYVVEALVKKFDIKADANQVRELVEMRASMYNEKDSIVSQILSDPKLLQEYEAVAVEDNLVKRLLENAKVNEIRKSFTEVMRPQQPEAAEHVHDENCNHEHEHAHEEK